MSRIVLDFCKNKRFCVFLHCFSKVFKSGQHLFTDNEIRAIMTPYTSQSGLSAFFNNGFKNAPV